MICDILANASIEKTGARIQLAKDRLAAAESHLKTLWNPNGVPPESILNSLSADSFPKIKIECYERLKAELEKELKSYQRKFETTSEDIRRMIRDCEFLLSNSPSQTSAEGELLISSDPIIIRLITQMNQSSKEIMQEAA